MRRLEDRTNYYAEAHRLDKAATLAEFIKKHYGAKQSVIDLLSTQSYEWWGSTAKEAGTNPPSVACVEAIVGILSADRPHPLAKRLPTHPDDALSGLPTP